MGNVPSVPGFPLSLPHLVREGGAPHFRWQKGWASPHFSALCPAMHFNPEPDILTGIPAKQVRTMQVTSSNFTVAEYCEQMRNGAIVVNHDYQRTDKVWPPTARSYLIDTILLGYPMPKLALHQTTDLKTRRTRKEIVDGQQRSQAIFDFLEDRLRLSGKTQFARKTYSQLEPEQQQRFVDYSLSLDLFVSATPEEIRQVFRRMNSYTVPLNPQEKRHAIHQGDFKWFVVETTERYADALIKLGVFTEKQLSRMADSALFSDIVFTFSVGIKSASDASLDKFYSDNDSNFPAANEMDARLSTAMNVIMGWPEIHNSALMKSYNFYTLVLAISHALNPRSELDEAYPRTGPVKIDSNFSLPNLTSLSSALEDPPQFPSLSPFVQACSKATNRIEPRRIRFQWISRALDPQLLP
jgi:hypothetical protein